MQCDRCRRDAIIHQPYSGLWLCDRHFILNFEARAKRAVRKHHWLCRGDHIAVVFTEKEEDRALLHFLARLTGRRRDITLSAIAGRGSALPEGVRCIPATFSEEYGAAFQDLAKAAGDAGISYGPLDRALLYRLAKRNNVSKLAFSSGIEDAAVHVLEQVLAGRPDRLLSLPERVSGPVPIRPFMYAPSEEIRLYSQMVTGSRTGPAAAQVFRNGSAGEVRRLLDDYTQRHPSAPYSLVSLCEQLSGTGMPVQGDIRLCDQCGEPCNGTCPICSILMEAESNAR